MRRTALVLGGVVVLAAVVAALARGSGPDPASPAADTRVGVPTPAGGTGVAAGTGGLRACVGRGAPDGPCVVWWMSVAPDRGDRLAVGRDRVAAVTPEGGVVARRRGDGGRLWETGDQGRPRLHGWAGDRLIATVGSRLAALGPRGERWSVRLPADVEQLGQFGAGVRRVLPGSDALYVIAGAELLALDPDDGATRWRWSRQHVLSAGVSGAGPYVVVVDGVVGLEAATGRERWRAPMVTFDNRPNLVAGGRVVVADDTGRVRGLDPVSGAVDWTHRVGGGGLARRLDAAGGAVLADTGRGGVVALDAAGGAVRWRLPPDRGRELAGAAADRAVAVSDGQLAGLDPATGRVRWRLPVASRVDDVHVGAVSLVVTGDRVLAVRGPGTGATP